MFASLGVSDYFSFCGAVLLFLALPGPGTLTLLTSTAQGGLRAGAAATAGVIAGDQVLLWLAVAGVAGLLAAYPVAFGALRWLGAAYLAWLGLRLIFAKAGAAPVLHLQPGHYLRQAFFITLLNPKAIVFYMAFFPLFIDPSNHRGALTFTTLALTIATITAVYCLGLCAGASALRQRLQQHPGWARTLEKLAGLALVAFSIRLGIQ